MVQFKKMVTVTADTPISECYPDLYAGNTKISDQSTGQIKAGKYSEKFAMSFKIPLRPIYGSADLTRLELGYYISDITLGNNSSSLPKITAYRINTSKPITEGVGTIESEDILVYASQMNDFTSGEENFNGKNSSGEDMVVYEPIQRSLFRKEKPYVTIKNLCSYGQIGPGKWHSIGGYGFLEGKEEEIAAKYGTSMSDIEPNFGPGGTYSISTTFETAEYKKWQAADRAWLPHLVGKAGDPPARFRQEEQTVTTTSTIGILEPSDGRFKDDEKGEWWMVKPVDDKQGFNIHIHDKWVYYANRDVIDNETYGNEVTTANSIFEYIRGANEFIGENKKAEGEVELFGVGAFRFSNKLQRTGGQSGQMYTFWKHQDDDPVNYPKKGPSGPTDRQEVLLAKKNIPLPAHLPPRPNWDRMDDEHFASSIEIDIYFESMELAYVHGSEDVDGNQRDTLTARRGLFICFSEEAPTQQQTFYDFVKHHATSRANSTNTTANVVSEGTTYTGKYVYSPLPTDDVRGTDTNVKNFAGIMILMTPNGLNISSSIYNVNNDSSSALTKWQINEGTQDIEVPVPDVYDDTHVTGDLTGRWLRFIFKVTPSGWNDLQGSYRSNFDNEGIYERSIHQYMSVSGKTMCGNFGVLQIQDLGSNEIIYDMSVISDDAEISNNDAWSMGSWSGSGVNNGNSLQSWPKHLSIWMTNYKADKNIAAKKDLLLDSNNIDTSNSVYIDRVSFNNFSLDVRNASIKSNNTNRGQIEIAPSSQFAGPNYPLIKNTLLEGMIGRYKTYAPTVLTFGFKNESDFGNDSLNGQMNFADRGGDRAGLWLQFHGFMSSNLANNPEIPDCNIRAGWSMGDIASIWDDDVQTDQLHADPWEWSYVHLGVGGTATGETIDDYYNGFYMTINDGLGIHQTRKIMDWEATGGTPANTAWFYPEFHTPLEDAGQSDFIIHRQVFGNQFNDENIGHRIHENRFSNGGVGAASHLATASSMRWQKNARPDGATTVGAWTDAVQKIQNHAESWASGTSTYFHLGGPSGLWPPVNDAYIGFMVTIEAGKGAGQIRMITDYTGSTFRFTINKPWTTLPNLTSKLRLRGAPYHNVQINNFMSKWQNSTSQGHPNLNAFGPAGLETKWFYTGLELGTTSATDAGDNITAIACNHQETADQRLLHSSSAYDAPIRNNDTLSLGTIGQVNHEEINVSSIVSMSLAATSASLVFKASTNISSKQAGCKIFTKLDNSVSNFTRKGFLHFRLQGSDSEEVTNGTTNFGEDGTDNVNHDRLTEARRPHKRENFAASARVTEIRNPVGGTLELQCDDINRLMSDDDEEYIIYLYGQRAQFKSTSSNYDSTISDSSPYAKTGLKIISFNRSTNTILLEWDGKANDEDTELATYDNLPALMISPYRYWFYIILDCTDESGQKALPPRSYTSISWMKNDMTAPNSDLAFPTGELKGSTYNHDNVAGTLTDRSNFGSTWNEYLYNSSTVSNVPGAYVNNWELHPMQLGSDLDCMKDYGFGSFDPENNTGGFVGLHIAQVDTQFGILSKSLNLMKMPNLASEGELHPGDTVNLLLTFQDESIPHTVTLRAKDSTDDTYDPFMYAVFDDPLPPRPEFSVKPNEENPYLPEFEWSASDDDLWYGLLHIDTSNIDNQYHNSVAWIPLNEATNVDQISGSAFVNNSISLWKRMYTHPRDTIGVANTGLSGVALSREGLAGYAGKFVISEPHIGSTTSYKLVARDEIIFPDFSNFPTGEMTAIVHFTPDAITGKQYLMYKSIPTAAATATVTFTGVPTNDETITISSAFTTKVYIKKAAQDLTTDPCQFHGATAAAAATSLKACIEDTGGGHDGEITVVNEDVAATATITITDLTELNNGDKVNLIATDGTSHDFTAGEVAGGGTWIAETNNNTSATNLAAAINGNAKFSAAAVSAVVTATQATAGTSGNTTVTLTDTFADGMTKTNFTNASGVLTLTQAVHGTAGNTTITETLSNATKTNFTGGLSAAYSDFEIYINSTGNVVAKATPTGTTTQVTLASSTIVSTASPTCAIITLDRELKSGNLKLYINGKLEDQTGAILTTATINNWKNQTNILDSSGELYLGCSYMHGNSTNPTQTSAGIALKGNYFGGLMEEIVIYNRCLYPVVPAVGNFILTKPISETDNKSPRSMQARLFIKDYHNIRGTTSQEVAASAPVGWSKAGFRIGDT